MNIKPIQQAYEARVLRPLSSVEADMMQVLCRALTERGRAATGNTYFALRGPPVKVAEVTGEDAVRHVLVGFAEVFGIGKGDPRWAALVDDVPRLGVSEYRVIVTGDEGLWLRNFVCCEALS